jgi:hypothetical protein
VNDESDLHDEKERSRSSLTEAGIQMDFKDENDLNAFVSISESWDLNSNAMN